MLLMRARTFFFFSLGGRRERLLSRPERPVARSIAPVRLCCDSQLCPNRRRGKHRREIAASTRERERMREEERGSPPRSLVFRVPTENYIIRRLAGKDRDRIVSGLGGEGRWGRAALAEYVSLSSSLYIVVLRHVTS